MLSKITKSFLLIYSAVAVFILSAVSAFAYNPNTSDNTGNMMGIMMILLGVSVVLIGVYMWLASKSKNKKKNKK